MTTPPRADPLDSVAVSHWTTRRLLAWIGEAFTKKGLDSPRLCAEILVSHVLGCERLKLYLDQDRPASEAERGRLRELVGRALRHEPIQYLVGEWPFFGIPMQVDRRALIPRPCTELIVERVVQDARARLDAAHKSAPLRIADVCTGSGCIAVAIAKQLGGARVVASDVSVEAIELARRNVERHGLADRVELKAGDLWGAFASELTTPHPIPLTHGEREEEEGLFDYVVSNPPYIPDGEWGDVGPEVRDYEPHLALRGGADGLVVVRPLIEGARRWMKPGAVLLVETAAATTSRAAEIAERAGFTKVRVLDDHEGLARVVEGVAAEMCLRGERESNSGVN